MGRKVILAPYDPLWVKQYEAAAGQLTAVFQPILVAMHHIGSTAIPGIKAKPTIDIMIVVTSVTAVEPLLPRMSGLGYLSKGENGIVGRHYFRKGSDTNHTHHVHVFGENHPEIARHLNFRDFLCHHQEDAQAYSQLKERLARQFFTDPEAYTHQKTSFIQEIDKKAHLWRRTQAVLS